MTVTMPTWLLAVTLVVSAAAGYASCYFGVVKIGTAIMLRRRSTNQEAEPMPNRHTPWVPLIMLVASAMVVTLGVMYLLEGRARAHEEAARAADQAAYDRCITQWGDDLVAAINDRSDAREKYDTAVNERADATAAVLNAALGLASDPPHGTEADVIDALRRARRADERVQRTKATLDATQDAATYEPPTLACADERK